MQTIKYLITGAALLLAVATAWAWSGEDEDVTGTWQLTLEQQAAKGVIGCVAQGVMELGGAIVKGGTPFGGTVEGTVTCQEGNKGGTTTFPFSGFIEGVVDGTDVTFTIFFNEGGPAKAPAFIKGCVGDDDDDDALVFEGTVEGDHMEGEFFPEDCKPDKGGVRGTWFADRISRVIPALGPVGLAVTALLLLGAGLLAWRRRTG